MVLWHVIFMFSYRNAEKALSVVYSFTSAELGSIWEWDFRGHNLFRKTKRLLQNSLILEISIPIRNQTLKSLI